MFKISSASQSYLTDIRVDMLDDNGKVKTQVFKARFKRVTQQELDRIHERLQEKSLNDTGLLNEVTVGFEDVKDDNGNPLEFNEDNFAALVNIFPVRPTMVNAFFTTINNAVRKN